jgi:E3 ubiquitin-protein ligase TRIP12
MLTGLRSLEPRLTVVKKVVESHSRGGQGVVDRMLPSASTCTNYLKLPEYSTRDVMRERLLVSLSHGQHSFHLS